MKFFSTIVFGCTFCVNAFGFYGYLHNQNLDDDIVFVANPVVLDMPSDSMKIGANQFINFYAEVYTSPLNDHEIELTYHAMRKSTSEILGTCKFIAHEYNNEVTISSSGQAQCNVRNRPFLSIVFELNLKENKSDSSTK